MINRQQRERGRHNTQKKITTKRQTVNDGKRQLETKGKNKKVEKAKG